MADSIITFMRERDGYSTMKEFKEGGIQTRKVREALEKDFIIKIKPGLYKLRYFNRDENENFIDICTANNSAVICLTSALAYHELTTFNPSKVTVAVPHNTDKFELEYPPIDVYFYRERIYNAGMETVQRSYGSFNIYNKPKTVCEMFHHLNKVGEDLAFEGLRNYLNLPESNLNKIQKYMGVCRVKTVIRPFIKALVQGK
jgi:predicted transcriptional regulator of viral defense system